METLQRTANRGSISTGFDIDNSVVFETANSERVYRANGNTGQRRTFTISAWVKRTALGYHRTFGVGVSGSNQMVIYFKDTHEIVWYDYHGGSYSFNYKTNRLFRDTSAWYHLVFAVDTEQGTEANRVRLYVNGVEETSFATQTEPSQNRETNWNYANGSKDVGNILNEAPFASCYMSEVYHINDQQLAPTDFGEFDDDTGIWKPKEFSGTFGSEDSYLNFDSSGSMGADSSGNSNDFTLSNITSADQATDTPTNNFCTLNPLMNNTGNYLAITEGGTRATVATTAYKTAASSIGVSSGKWYWEVKLTNMNTITAMGVTMPYYWDTDYTFGGCVYYGQPAQRYNNSSASFYGATYATGDIIGFALDMDATTPTMTCYKNNVSQGNLFSGLSIGGAGAALLPPKEDFYFAKLVAYGNNTFDINFGGYTAFTISSAASDAHGYGTFEFAPPSGFYSLCSQNLALYG